MHGQPHIRHKASLLTDHHPPITVPQRKNVRKIAEDQLLASSDLSIHMEKLSSHWMDFHEILHSSIFLKICQENSSSVKI